jgi:uncharacterized Tic20 family protein
MNISITTPALLFSAITLMLLAYTNRFLAIANLIRQAIALYEEKNDDHIYLQIKNFEKRLELIKYTQIFGVVSFILCVVSMFFIFIDYDLMAKILFLISLLSMVISLSFSLYELLISIGALRYELKKIEKLKE